MALSCKCGASISRQSKTGRCRPCALRDLNADPAFQARRQARLNAAMKRPDVKERHRAGCKRGAAMRMADPVKAERLREIGRQHGSANIVHAMTPEARAKCGVAVREHYLAWCPPEYRALNTKLKNNAYRLPDRKRIIAAAIAEDRAKERAVRDAELAALPAFERQQAKLAAGGRLVEKFRPRAAEPSRTLGGVASGML